jgi:hypothetical protein
VAGFVEDVKLTGGPPLRQLPRRIQRAADVVAAVDQDAGNAVQCRGITEQLVLPEKGGVPPVMRDQAREPEAKFRIFVARILAAINISETAFSASSLAAQDSASFDPCRAITAHFVPAGRLDSVLKPTQPQ